MGRKQSAAPRRLPRQDRAQDTVEVILEATARVMIQEGYHRATTNRIATVAGVSIGSLYRYFPTKDALLAAIYQRVSDRTMARFAEVFEAAKDAPLAEALRAVIGAELQAHAGDAPLHQILFERVPHTGARAHLDAILERYVGLVRDQLIARRGEIRDVDPERAAFMLVHALNALSHEALQRRPAYLADEAYLDECVRLALRFLT